METKTDLEIKPWGSICPQCQGSGKNSIGAPCLNCAGYGQLTPDPAASVPMERTFSMTEKPVLREPNGRKARDLYSNSSLRTQIIWVKGRIGDVNSPYLRPIDRNAARLNLTHCLQKDDGMPDDHKLPLNLRLEAEKLAEEPLEPLPKRRLRGLKKAGNQAFTGNQP